MSSTFRDKRRDNTRKIESDGEGAETMTTAAVQWKTAKIRGNKTFHGFGGFIFLFFNADKYGGDFAVSCDEEKFRAEVML